MKPTKTSPFSPDIDALLDAERVVVEQPDEVRVRAFLRARAAMSKGSLRPRSVFGFKWMLAAAVLFVAVSLSAAAIRARRQVEVPPYGPSPAAAKQAEPAPIARSANEPFIGDVAKSTGQGEVPSAAPLQATTSRPATSAETYALELKLLQPARAAVARGDFAAALSAITEHERRFAAGQLTEEREALRVQALMGLHRTDEARRAAITFRTRFPNSVLLSRMKSALQANP
jgi:hypothetical protein